MYILICVYTYMVVGGGVAMYVYGCVHLLYSSHAFLILHIITRRQPHPHRHIFVNIFITISSSSGLGSV